MAGQDIPMNAFKLLADAAYIYGESTDNSQGKMKKSDLLNDCFSYRGSLSRYDDTGLKTGYYADYNYAQDRPAILTAYGLIAVIAQGTSMIIQLHVSTLNKWHVRIFASNAWSDWKSITLT